MATIGEKIFRLRRQHGISQEELADKINVTRQAVSKWETGSTVANSENITALCKLFNVSADYFLDDGKEIAVGSAEVAENVECSEQENGEEQTGTTVETKVMPNNSGKRVWIILMTIFAVLCAVSISVTAVLIAIIILGGKGYETVYAIRVQEWLLPVCVVCTIVFLAAMLITIFCKDKFFKRDS